MEKLNTLAEGTVANITTLRDLGLLAKSNKNRRTYKVVGGTELTVSGLTICAHAFTKSAKLAIENNGGKAVVLCRTKQIPIEEANLLRSQVAAVRLVKLKKLRALRASKQVDWT